MRASTFALILSITAVWAQQQSTADNLETFPTILPDPSAPNTGTPGPRPIDPSSSYVPPSSAETITTASARSSASSNATSSSPATASQSVGPTANQTSIAPTELSSQFSPSTSAQLASGTEPPTPASSLPASGASQNAVGLGMTTITGVAALWALS